MEDHALYDMKRTRLLRYLGSDPTFRIPARVAILGNSSFAHARNLTTVTFAPGSVLRRIESCTFLEASLKSIRIPKTVSYIDGTSWSGCDLDSISIHPDNPYFYIAGPLLMDTSGRLVRYLAVQPDVVIGARVRTFGSYAFYGRKWLSSITFAADAVLRKLESYVFLESCLRFLDIPPTLEVIDGTALGSVELEDIVVQDGNEFFRVENGLLIEINGRRAVRYFGTETVVTVNSDILVLGQYCFCNCKALTAVVFAPDSHLKRIEGNVFAGSSVHSLTLPRSVSFIEGPAISDSKIERIAIEDGSLSLAVDGDFVLDLDHQRVVRYLGSKSRVEIAREIRVLGKSSFKASKSLLTVSFAPDTQLLRIESNAFFSSTLKSFCVPATVRFLEASAFSATDVESIQVEEGNLYFSVKNQFLLDFEGARIHRYNSLRYFDHWQFCVFPLFLAESHRV
jgi:hypothetical protein